jgi:hypothetical protein
MRGTWNLCDGTLATAPVANAPLKICKEICNGNCYSCEDLGSCFAAAILLLEYELFLPSEIHNHVILVKQALGCEQWNR